MSTAPTELSRYERRGVSSDKTDVHAAIKNLDKGLFPGAFCKILPDILGDPPDPDMVNLSHPDGAGTKAILAYLVWKLTKDRKAVRRIAQCSLVMNLDDAGCVGADGPFLITQSVNRNAARVTGEAITEVIGGCQELCDKLTSLGIPCAFASGETADVGNAVRTWVVGNNLTARFRRVKVIDASAIAPGQLLVGFSSTGKATWEDEVNSGMGANGLTNAQHDALCPDYRQNTETYAPETDLSLIYCGQHHLDDPLPGDSRFSVAQAMLSPTRTYLPLLKKLFDMVGRKNIAGLIHNSGGGQAKIRKFGRAGNLYIKDQMLPIPPLFRWLQGVRGLPWRDMFKNYNMGSRLEAAVPSRSVADDCIAIAKECGIVAQIIGRVEENTDGPKRKVRVISSEIGELEYTDE
jgi:phosphoribosylformylglycinamidine cyclo-ligase